jgi:CRISPR-associated endonuclease/helicase Cas3
MSTPTSSTESPLAIDPCLWRLWAKWPRSKEQQRKYHPVICHLIDVASVTRLMWSRALTPAQRARIADGLNHDDSEAAGWLAFWAGLHDLGKASPAFQTQLADKPDGLLIAGWLAQADLNTRGARWAPHGGLSLLLMEDILPRVFGHSEALAERVAAIVGAHHGLFFTREQSADLNQPELIGEVDGPWARVQEDLARRRAAALGVPTRTPTGQLARPDAMALAGLISTADWLGSNTRDYKPTTPITVSPPPLDLATYAARAARQAEQALARVAWDHLDLRDQPRAFSQLFPKITKLRKLQEQVVEIAKLLTGPGLVIVESPMGEGKTEAAMYIADNWSVTLGQRGIYFALPTQATSNQMFNRVKQFLTERFTGEDQRFVNLSLAHGMAALSPEYEELQKQARLIDLVESLEPVKDLSVTG